MSGQVIRQLLVFNENWEQVAQLQNVRLVETDGELRATDPRTGNMWVYNKAMLSQWAVTE